MTTDADTRTAVEAVGRALRAEAELAAALAVIENAPHETRCLNPDGDGITCTCWKSTVDTSALAAREFDPDEWATLKAAERRRQIEKGYDAEHDREHGIEHVLRWAGDYLRRDRRVEAGAMIDAALDALAVRDAEKWDEGRSAGLHDFPRGILERTENPYCARAEKGANRG